MSNDIGTSAPAASAPASTPSSAPPAPSTPIEPTPPEDLAHMAQADDIEKSGYADQRLEDDGKINQDASEAQRHFNRHQRKNKTIELLRAENAKLKEAQSGPRSPTDGTPDSLQEWHDEVVGDQGAPPAAAEQPSGPGDEQQQRLTPEEFEQQIFQQANETLQRAERKAVFRERQKIAASIFPDHAQILAQAPQVPIPQALGDRIVSSTWGPVLQYALARPEGQRELVALLQASPREAERMIDKWEATIEAHYAQAPSPQQQRYQQPQQRRITQARPPIKPLTGSAGPSPNLKSLAESSDDITGYAQQRLRQMRSGKTSR